MSLLDLGKTDGAASGSAAPAAGAAPAAAESTTSANAGGVGGADAGVAGGSAAAGAGAAAGAPAAVVRPDHIPEKFWDTEKAAPKIDELAKSYVALEQIQGRGKTAWEQDFFKDRPAT